MRINSRFKLRKKIDKSFFHCDIKGGFFSSFLTFERVYSCQQLPIQKQKKNVLLFENKHFQRWPP